MACDDDVDRKARRPAFGGACAAPDRDARNARWHGEIVPQRKVIHENDPDLCRYRSKPLLSPRETRSAPRFPRIIRMRRQQVLVCGAHARFRGPGHGSLVRHVVRTKRVVVQNEGGHDRGSWTLTWPHRVRILRRQHAVAPADLDETSVVRLATLIRRPLARRPEIVIPGRPDDLREARGQLAQHPVEL